MLFAALGLLFSKRLTIAEWAGLVGLPILLLVLSQRLLHSHLVRDLEYWGGFVRVAEYYEPWNERVSCSHTIECRHLDEDGEPIHTDDGKEHAYDVDDHPAYWEIIDSNNLTVTIDRYTYERLARKFGPGKFVDLHRDYHNLDGDKYVITGSAEPDQLEAVTTEHSYENRILASRSVYRYEEVEPADYGLFDYPKITGFYQCPALLGVEDRQASRALDSWNARLGPPKQLRLMVLVFVDKPREAALEQEAYWQGGNKNEFVVCVGVDAQRRPQWSHVFSWTEVEELKLEARDRVMQQPDEPLDLVALIDWLGQNVGERFVRKSFSDFAHLAVEPPLWAILLIHALLFGFSLAWLAWSVLNQYSPPE